jgi:uncharacterized protein HemX
MSELGPIIQGGGIVLSGALVFKLLDIALKVWATRNQKTQVEPQPLDVVTEKKAEYVTKEEFKRHVEEVQRRFEAGNAAFKELRKEISGMREDLHAGLNKINDRISPVAEACAANSAAIQILLKERDK